LFSPEHLLGCAPFGRFIAWLSSWDWTAFVNTLLAALAGSAVGSMVVFWVENKKRKVRSEDEHIVATNLAIALLARAWDNLNSFRIRRIELVRDNPFRWFLMGAGNILELPERFDTASLAFLFESGQPQLPIRIQWELDQFEGIRLEILVRTREHVENLQPKIEAAGLVGGVDANAVIQAAGPRLVGTLHGLTESIIQHVDGALPTIRATADALRAAVRAKYPKRTVIGFEPSAAGPT
jgi:hypothetical protein